MGIVDTDTNTYYHDNDNEKQVQTVGVSTSVDQVVKVFDINTTGDDKYLNTLLSKQVVKRIKGNEYLQCDVFRKWREQTDLDIYIIIKDISQAHLLLLSSMGWGGLIW